MKKINLLVIILLSIVPELILWFYLYDILNKGFLDTILFIYFIIITLGILRYIMSEISFRLFIKNKMIDNIYSQLLDNKFPNPWNYYIDDWISYFDEVWRDVNNELLETNIINCATSIYIETKTLYDQNSFWQYFRVKSCLKIAVKRYKDDFFKTSSDNLIFSEENLLKIFKKYNFPDPKILEFDNPLMYLDLVVNNEDSSLFSKIYACKLRHLIWKISSEINSNVDENWIDESSNKKVLYNHIDELWQAINVYSKV